MLSFLTSEWVGIAILGIIVLPVFLVFVTSRPDAATVTVFFLMYSNIAVIAKLHYGVPHVVAASFCLLLTFPLMSYIVFNKEKIIIDIPLLLMIGFLLLLLLSALMYAKNLDRAIDWVITYFLEGLLLYFLIINVVRNLETLRRVVWIMLLAGSLLGALTLYQEITGNYKMTFGGLVQRQEAEIDSEELGSVKNMVARHMSPRKGIHRAGGPLGDINRFAQIMTVLLPLALFRYWGEGSWLLKLLAVASTVLILGGILLTYSRGAFVTILGLLLIMTIMRYIKAYQLFIALAALIILITTVAPGYLERMDTIRGVQGFFSKDVGVKPDAITRSRVTEMLAALYVFLDYPILGVGPGQYSKYYSREYMQNPEIAFRRMDKSRRAHCLYTELAAETGALGLTVFMGIVFIILYQLWGLRRHFAENRPDLVNFATALMLGIFAYLGTAIFLHLSYQRYFWLIMGLAGAGIQILLSEKENNIGSEQVLHAKNVLSDKSII